MRKYLFLLLAVFLMGMGDRPIPETPDNPSPSANSPQSLEQSFRALAKTYGSVLIGKAISFYFRNFFGSTIGMCTMNGSGYNSVALSSSAWASGSNTFKEMLVFHELGHCLLGRGHNNSTHSDGRKESLMNSYIFDSKTYLANRDAYLKELFMGTKETMFSGAARRGRDGEREKIFDGCRFGR